MLTGDKNEFGDFSRIKLDEMKARGGAGSIWTVSGQKNIVAKIYHKDVNIREYQPKIEAMIFHELVLFCVPLISGILRKISSRFHF